MMANPNDEIVRLYVDEKKSVGDIALRLKTSYNQIYHVLRSRVAMRDEDIRNVGGVAETIRDRIVTGEWKPDEKIPSQLELADAFGVSTQTIAKAARHLSQRGYLRVLPNRGTYVQPKRYWDQQEETREVN